MAPFRETGIVQNNFLVYLLFELEDLILVDLLSANLVGLEQSDSDRTPFFDLVLRILDLKVSEKISAVPTTRVTDLVG